MRKNITVCDKCEKEIDTSKDFWVVTETKINGQGVTWENHLDLCDRCHSDFYSIMAIKKYVGAI